MQRRLHDPVRPSLHKLMATRRRARSTCNHYSAVAGCLRQMCMAMPGNGKGS